MNIISLFPEPTHPDHHLTKADMFLARAVRYGMLVLVHNYLSLNVNHFKTLGKKSTFRNIVFKCGRVTACLLQHVMHMRKYICSDIVVLTSYF